MLFQLRFTAQTVSRSMFVGPSLCYEDLIYYAFGHGLELPRYQIHMVEHQELRLMSFYIQFQESVPHVIISWNRVTDLISYGMLAYMLSFSSSCSFILHVLVDQQLRAKFRMRRMIRLVVDQIFNCMSLVEYLFALDYQRNFESPLYHQLSLYDVYFLPFYFSPNPWPKAYYFTISNLRAAVLTYLGLHGLYQKMRKYSEIKVVTLTC